MPYRRRFGVRRAIGGGQAHGSEKYRTQMLDKLTLTELRAAGSLLSLDAMIERARTLVEERDAQGLISQRRVENVSARFSRCFSAPRGPRRTRAMGSRAGGPQRTALRHLVFEADHVAAAAHQRDGAIGKLDPREIDPADAAAQPFRHRGFL